MSEIILSAVEFQLVALDLKRFAESHVLFLNIIPMF